MKTNEIEFNFKYSLESFATYLSLVFSDDDYKPQTLYPIVLRGINKGITRYLEKNRDVDYLVYLTFFAKNEVKAFKKLK